MALPLLRGSSGLRPLSGFGGRRNTLDPYLPNQAEVAQAGAELEQEQEPSFFFKLLQIPNRLLFGQSIQGFLEGTFEDGVGEGLRKGFVNNPLFQILEGVGLGEVTGDALEAVGLKEEGSVGLVEDTDFSKVREAYGWDGPENAVARFAVDLLGELATSPLELMWRPFGLSAKGVAAASELRGAGRAVTGIAADQISPSLTKAVLEQGTKTMMAFKVPFKDTWFHAWSPKFMESHVAKTIEGVADFMHNNPITGSLFKLFNKNKFTGTAVERFQGKEAVKLAETARLGLESVALVKLTDALVNLPKDYLERPEISKLMIIMQETGLEGVDNASDLLRKIQEGVYRGKPNAYIDQLMYKESLGEVLDDVERRALDEYQAGTKAADFQDVSSFRPDRVEVDISDLGAPGHRGETAARGKVGRETPGITEGFVQESRFETVPEILNKIMSAENGEELFQSIKKTVQTLDELGADLATSDKLGGVLDDALTPYFPRSINPKLRDAIDAQASKFLKGRKFSDLTVLEVNALMMEHGTKFTRGMSLTEISKVMDEEATWYGLSKVFPESFVQKMKKTFGEEARVVTDFYEMNPQTAWYNRIKSSAKKAGAREFYRAVFQEGSPLLERESTWREILTDPKLVDEMVKKGYHAYELAEDGGKFVHRALSQGELVGAKFELNLRGMEAQAYNDLLDFHTKAKKTGELEDSELLTYLDEVLNINVRHKPSARPEGLVKGFEAGEKGERAAARWVTMEKDLRALEAGPMKDHPLTHTIREQIDIYKMGEQQYGEKFLEEAERSFLRNARGEYGDEALMAEGIAQLRTKIDGTKKTLQAEKARLKELLLDTDPDPSRVESLRETIKSLEDDIFVARDGLKDTRKYRQYLEEKSLKRGRRAREWAKERENTFRNATMRFRDELRMERKEFRDILHDGVEMRGKLIKGAASTEIESSKEFEELFQMWRTLRHKGLNAVDNMAKDHPELLEKFLDKAGDGRVVFMDKKHYDQFLDPENGVLAQLSKPDKFAQTLGALDMFTTLWKTWTLNPAFTATRSRDHISNLIMQVQGGARPASLMKSNRWFTSAVDDFMKTGDFEAIRKVQVPQEIMELTGTKNAEEFFHLLQREGVTSFNIIQERFTVGVGEKVFNLNKGMPLKEAAKQGRLVEEAMTKASGVRTPFVKAGVRWAEKVDATTKINAFLDHLRQGKPIREAAQTVRQWGYDHRLADLSHFEKTVLRRFMPFYAFARIAIGQQLEAFFTKPGAVTWFEKTSRVAGRAQGLSNAEQEAMLPEFVRDGFGIPLDLEDGVFKVKLFGSLIPLAQVGDLANAIQASFDSENPDGISKYLGKSLNPWFKAPLESVINKSFFTQRPIERYEGQKVEYLGIDMSPKLKNSLMSIRFLNEIENLGILGNKDIEAMSLSKRKRAEDGFFVRLLRDSAFSPFSPVTKPYYVDVAKQADYAISREGSALSRDKRNLSRAVQEKDKGLSDENIATLRKLIAKRMAKIEYIQKSAQEFQQ